VVNRARSALAEVGLELPRSLLDLERSIISLRHRLRTLRGAALVQPARSVVGPALTGEPHATVELLR
jgi:hypothetical protein